MSKPYLQHIENNIIERVFDKNIDSDELVWHKDKKDREVKVLQSNGWLFQMDNEIPKELKEGDTIFIPKEIFHRVIKGKGNLKIQIKE